MRRTTLLLAATFLAAATLAASPALAQQQGGTDPQQQGADKAGTAVLGSPGGAAATQGGVQGNCPPGQVVSAAGGCAPGQPGAAGAGTSSTEMPASPHQQELLKGQQGSESTPK